MRCRLRLRGRYWGDSMFRMCRPLAFLAGSLASGAMLATVAEAQTVPSWQRSLSSKVVAIDTTAFGSMLVLSKSGLLAVDPESGRDRWTRPDVSDYQMITGTPYAVFTTSTGQVIAEIESGTDVWKFSGLGLSAVKDVIHLPAAGVVLAAGPSPQSPHTLVAAEYRTGQILWTQTALFKEPALAANAAKVRYRRNLLDSEQSVILDPSHDGLMRLDLRSGQLLWRIPEAMLASKGKWVDLFQAGDHLLVAYDKKLFSINRADGKVEWARAAGFPSPLFQASQVRKGLLVRGGYNTNNKGRMSWKPYLALLDPATGASRWTTEKTRFDGRSAYLVEEDTVTVALKDGVSAFDIDSGKPVLTHAMPEFGGGEHACCLERTDEGRLLVWSSQNLRMLAPSGKLEYSVFLKAPGASFMAKLGTIALLAAATAGSYAMAPPGGLYTVFGPGSDSPLTAKFRASTDAERYLYVFTEDAGTAPDRFALVRLDKDTGKDTGRVKFTQRSPLFRLEPGTSVVVAADEARLYGVRFPGTGGRR